jgi:hypothetical protein
MAIYYGVQIGSTKIASLYTNFFTLQTTSIKTYANMSDLEIYQMLVIEQE